ncbi:hypothetical protein J5491_04150 [Candidatus Saccharibacteria bacterium]|nr:hypothetical protein [Candidatus Saccharibacteria bacterium]
MSNIKANIKEFEQIDKYDIAVADVMADYADKTAFEQDVMRDIIINERITKDFIENEEKRLSNHNKILSSEKIKEYFEHDFNNGMNCGGFALGIFGCIFTHTKSLEEATKLLLEKFPFVRLQDDEEIGPDEYRVLYRHQEGGFSHHFVKEEGGKLIEKDGSGPVKDFEEWPDNLKDAPEVTLIVNRNHNIEQYDEDGHKTWTFGI